MALAPIRAREFSLPRGGQGHSQFYSIGFYVYSAAFFGTFLGSKKLPSSRPPVLRPSVLPSFLPPAELAMF